MYYYYDILLNFTENEEELYEFYEWEETDNIEFIKKIPLFKINSNTLKTLIKYQVKFDSGLLEQIKNKTILKNNNNPLPYCLLLSDAKNAIALELDSTGKVISRSKMLLNDEINLNEIMFTIKEHKLNYEKIQKYPENNEIRQIKEIKKVIICEIKNLFANENISKLKYLYYEWFDKESDNLQKIYKDMLYDLHHNYSEKQNKIYQIIKLSYDKVK